MPYQTMQVPAATDRMMNQSDIHQSNMPRMGMSQQNMGQQNMNWPRAEQSAQRQEWAGEITPVGGANAGMGMTGGMMPPMQPQLQMSHGIPSEVIEAPTDRNEAFLGSLKAMLLRNKGNYIVATFLIGTQGTVTWEGVLYEVGNDFVTIYQEGRDRYIVCDIYSLKYMEFYDTRRRELCDAMLQQRPWQGMM